MKRVGFVGTENSHVKHFIRFLNQENRHEGYKGVALAGGQSDHNKELAEFGGIDTIVDDPSELVDVVDMAIVSNRDGNLHLPAAAPLLKAGKPVLVDKPLAASVEDAQELLQIARDNGTRICSYSALRFVPEIEMLKAESEDDGELRHMHIVGAADPDSEYAGIFFYGIHHVETALEILGNPVVKPGEAKATATRHGDTVVAQTRIADVDITFTFIKAQPGSPQVGFHAANVHTKGMRATKLTLDADYNAPALKEFIEETKPMTDEQMLTPVVVLAAIAEAIR